MSKSLIALSLWLSFGCGSSSTPEIITDAGVEANPIDATTDLIDASDDQSELDVYRYCASYLVHSTNYIRLLEVDCVDSNGISNFDHFYDIQLAVDCHWKLAQDDIQRCLPDNETTDFLFADEGCLQAISLVKMIDGSPEMPYVGLDAYKTDAAITDTVYLITNQWDASYFFYRTISDDGGISCDITDHLFPGFDFYFVGDEVSPDTFVER